MTDTTEAPTAPLPPAPGTEAHVSLALANSAVCVPQHGIVELLSSPEVATQWLVDHDLARGDIGLQEYCAGLLKELRDHTREVFDAVVNNRAPAAASMTAVNHALTRTPTARLLAWGSSDGFHPEMTHPIARVTEHAMAQIAADVVAVVTGPDAGMLTACDAAPCNRYFIRTHGRRQWCSKRCGDRVRAARSYARRRDG